jgi:hypothetical protein
MQISNAGASPALTSSGTSAIGGTTTPDLDTASTSSADASATATDTPATSTTANPSQDAAVNISPEGAAMAAQDPGTAGTSTDTSADASDGSGNTVNDTANTSPLKSFTYGTLGLERPDQPQDNQNAFYTAGRWLAAGLTIGGIISLLV